MKEEIFEFLESKRTCVLAVEMMDGAPHVATLHFAVKKNPFIFYFETASDYRKAEPLLKRVNTRASLVIGTDESVMKTLQLDGEAKIVSGEEIKDFENVYFSKFPEKKNKKHNLPPVYFCFTPTWWRFTDWTKPTGKAILVSNEVDFKL